jgi:hypothetical protein
MTKSERTELQPEPAALPAPSSTRDRLAVLEQELVEYEEHDEAHLPRSLQSKLFGIPFSGWFQLLVICIVAGAIFQAGGIDFFSPDFTFTGVAGSLATGTLNLLGWAVENGLRPLLSGALIIIPLWLAWRLLTVPFRN